MVSVRAVTAGAVVAFALAFCAGCTVAAADRPLPETPAAAVTAQVPARPTAPVWPSPSVPVVLSKADTIGAESTPWKPVALDGRTLTIRYVVGGGCQSFKGVRVRSSEKSVEVWTVVSTDKSAAACTDALALGAARVVLDRPLGDRTLLHAPVSKQWRSYADNLG